MSFSKKRFDASLESYAKEKGLIHKDYVLTEPYAAIADWLETESLNQAKQPTEKSKKVNDAVKTLIKALTEDS